MFQLKLTSAPVILHFPASGKRKKEDKFDLERLEILLVKENCLVKYIKNFVNILGNPFLYSK